MIKPYFKKIELSNSLRILMHQISAINSVTIEMVVKAGPRYESQEKTGMAHFLEHMLFEGTRRFQSSKQLAIYLESVGGRSGAWTNKENVVYYVKVPSQHLKIAFDYLSEILFNSLLTEEAIEKEKNIVLEELHRKNDNVESHIWDVWMEWVWGKQQTLGRPTIGYKETIQSFTKAGLNNYLGSLYSPENMVLGVVGNFNQKDVLEYSQRYFGTLSSHNNIANFDKASFIPKNKIVQVVRRNTEQAQLVLGFVTGISYLHPDRFPMRILADTLSLGVSSRLFHRLVYELGLAYSAGAGDWLFTDTGLFYAFGGFSPGKIDEAVNIIAEEIQRLKKQKVPKKELKEVKEKDIASMLFNLESSEAIADYLSITELLENKVLTPDQVKNKINKVTQEDIQVISEKYLNRKNLAVTIIGPINESDSSKIENALKLLN